MRKLIGIAFLAFCGVSFSEQAPKIEFYERPCIKPYTDYTFQTCNPFVVRVNDEHVIIPRNFITDLASIPRPLWSLMAPDNAAVIEPSILHDFLYRCPNSLSRKAVDNIFYAALRKNKNPWYSSMVMYYAVRVFGSSHFSEGHYCAVQLELDEQAEITRKYFNNKE